MREMKGVWFGRRWSSMLWLAAGLLAAGCSSGSGTFTTLTLNVSSTGFDAKLSGPGCPTLGDVSVTFDGAPGLLLNAGGTGRDLNGGTTCQEAELALNRTIDFAQAVPTTEMTISGSVSMHAVFTQLIAPVTLAVAGTPPLTPGSTVTFALDPSSDVFLAAGVGPKLRWDTPAGIVAAPDAQVSGNMITATIPGTAHAGDQLSFSYGQGTGVIQAATQTCEGATSCAGYPLIFVDPVSITVQ
jgi:hypothetical protein